LVLHWIYVLIAVLLLGLVVWQMFVDKRWREQAALAMLVVPLLLRILHIK